MNMGVVSCLPLTKFVLLSFSFNDMSNFKVTVRKYVSFNELCLVCFPYWLSCFRTKNELCKEICGDELIVCY